MDLAIAIIVQLFQWNWDSIAQECTQYLGPAGYEWVQISPPSEHVTGDSWWTDYQVVSYTLTSKRGNRDQFANMVSTCKSAGVNIIADVIWNHMAGTDSGSGVAGNTFTHYDYPGTYSGFDFHYCGTTGDAILDWGNKTQLQTCQLENLADLNTETEYVRSRLAQYGNDLLSLGVAGFRLDAAKHVNIDSLSNIVSRLSSKPYITQEALGSGQPIPPESYNTLGDVTVSDYYGDLQKAFTSTNLASLNGIEKKFAVASSGASVTVATHDSEHGSGSLTYQSANNSYTLAHVFMLAYPYGTPTILSSYTFDNTDAGGPNGNYGTCYGSGGVNGWLCQHRWTPIAGMAAFRNTVGSAAVSNWQQGSTNQIAFGRGSAGFVAINNESGAWSKTFTTSLPDGTYCNVIDGAISSGACSASTFTVAGGKFTATVRGYWAIALHTGAKL
ncbi:glycoside hydrolase family 13 protein [Punctularia strigosozonata HHB-11173 SS5]|uniref:glycoside hydrolase family 13 protein n=1 Tax=Punctularia strigosozonata (strain HHB-11173) TaxID=741275 RepID=UPI0004417DD5|nr:glycoside hydrolase family 13 protein [Punctularia strigosozonata HHB-11173 SS5]EIN05398.1 glycoside hydrolase family 13 protein [Punctularia strigosozonata HHB-11173 SS5]